LREVIDEQVLAVAFSPEGERLVTAGARHVHPGQIKFWDVATRREVRKVRGLPGTRAVAFSPDGRVLACGEFGGAIALRDARTGEPLANLRGHTVGVNSLAYSRDGAWLVSAGLDLVVKLWDVKARAERRAFSGHTDSVYTVAFFRHGGGFVSGGADRTARVWEVNRQREKFVLRGHQAPVEQVAISPDDKVIATAGWDNTIKLWDAETGVEKAVLAGHQAPVYAVAFSGDGAWLASGSADGEVRLWDAKKRSPAASLGKHDSAAWGVAFSPDNRLLASGGSDRTARLWDVATHKPLATLSTSEYRPVSAAVYSPDGKTVAIATDAPTIGLFDAGTGKEKATLTGHADPVTCLAYSPDGLTLASGSKDSTVRLWDPTRGAPKHVLDGHTGPVHAVAFAPDGRSLATAGEDATVNVWDPEAGTRRKAYKGHTGPVHAVAFAPGSALLASGGADGAVLLWGADASAGPGRLAGHDRAVRALTFAGEVLLSGSEDGTIRVWEPPAGDAALTAGRKSRTLSGHPGGVSALAYLGGADGFVSGGSDGEIMQWELSTGAPREVLRGHQGKAVTALTIHPGGEELLSGSLDTQILRWRDRKSPWLLGQPAPAAGNNTPGAPVELKEFYQDFRGGKSPESPLALFGTKASLVTRAEERGLHIRVEANPEQTERIGLRLPARFRGDFEITAGYEILRPTQPERGHSVGVSLLADLDSPAGEVLEVVRAGRVREGQIYGGVRKTVFAGKEQYQQHWHPTESKAGQLRMTRKGAELIWSARDAGEGAFTELCRLDCGTEDVKQIRFVAYMGFAPNSVDVVLKDLRVAPPSAGGANAGPSGPNGDASDPPARPRTHLVLFGLLLAFAFAAATFLVLFATRRKRREAGGRAEASPDEGPPPGAVVFACSHCGKRLRVRKALTGKQASCPQCGGKVVIPESGA
jgi:WD40 repeat protein